MIDKLFLEQIKKAQGNPHTPNYVMHLLKKEPLFFQEKLTENSFSIMESDSKEQDHSEESHKSQESNKEK